MPPPPQLGRGDYLPVCRCMEKYLVRDNCQKYNYESETSHPSMVNRPVLPFLTVHSMYIRSRVRRYCVHVSSDSVENVCIQSISLVSRYWRVICPLWTPCPSDATGQRVVVRGRWKRELLGPEIQYCRVFSFILAV